MLRRRWLKVVVFLLCLAPFVYLAWRFYRQDLTANPLEYITHFTGDLAVKGRRIEPSDPTNTRPSRADRSPRLFEADAKRGD